MVKHSRRSPSRQDSGWFGRATTDSSKQPAPRLIPENRAPSPAGAGLIEKGAGVCAVKRTVEVIELDSSAMRLRSHHDPDVFTKPYTAERHGTVLAHCVSRARSLLHGFSPEAVTCLVDIGLALAATLSRRGEFDELRFDEPEGMFNRIERSGDGLPKDSCHFIPIISLATTESFSRSPLHCSLAFEDSGSARVAITIQPEHVIAAICLRLADSVLHEENPVERADTSISLGMLLKEADLIADKTDATKITASLVHSKRARAQAVRGGEARKRGSPKTAAMEEIRKEWTLRNRPGAGFALEMAVKYQRKGVDLSEGGIKNAIVRWRRGSK